MSYHWPLSKTNTRTVGRRIMIKHLDAWLLYCLAPLILCLHNLARSSNNFINSFASIVGLWGLNIKAIIIICEFSVMCLPSEVQHAHSDNALIPHSQVLHFRAIPLNSSRILLLLCTAHVRPCKLACIFIRPPCMHKSGALSHSTFLGNEAPLARGRLPIG